LKHWRWHWPRDGLLAPLNKRVYSIVNYDRFEADPEIMDAYLDLVRYVEERYYIAVSRYTNSGFMRLKLGSELEKRKVSSHVFESGAEARQHLKSSGRREYGSRGVGWAKARARTQPSPRQGSSAVSTGD
jgi:propionate CoA-transferase